MYVPRLLVTAAVLLGAGAGPAVAEVQLTMKDGRVSLTATSATTREILAEWARVGQTRIVNGERVSGPPVTLSLENMPEAEALDIVLRAVSGYVASPRPSGADGVSRFDRILVIPSPARPRSAAVSTAAPTFAQSPAVFDPQSSDNPAFAETLNELRRRAEEALRANPDTAVVGDRTTSIGVSFEAGAAGIQTTDVPETPPAADTNQPPPRTQRPGAPAGVSVPGMIVPAPTQGAGQSRPGGH